MEENRENIFGLFIFIFNVFYVLRKILHDLLMFEVLFLILTPFLVEILVS